MATLRSADVGDQIPEVWAGDLYAQAENMTYWGMFEGLEGSGMPVVRKDDLAKGTEGDTIRTDIVLALTGAGTTGDTSGALLEGAEEQMKFRQQSFTVDALQHAVRFTWKANVQLPYNLREAAKNQLAKWLAGKLDDRVFVEITGGAGATTLPTTAKFVAGDQTAIGSIDADNIVTLNDITQVKALAQVQNKIEPIRVDNDGNEYFGLLLHPYAAMHLKMSAAWQQAQREGNTRGPDNPIFRGNVGMWDGVVIYTSNRVPIAADGAAGVDVARNVFFGAQAISRGYGAYPDWVEEEFSYGQEVGIATKCIVGQKLNVFDLTSGGGAAAADFTAIGSIVVYSYAEPPTA